MHLASTSKYDQNPWIIHLAGKLLLNDFPTQVILK